MPAEDLLNRCLKMEGEQNPPNIHVNNHSYHQQSLINDFYLKNIQQLAPQVRYDLVAPHNILRPEETYTIAPSYTSVYPIPRSPELISTGGVDMDKRSPSSFQQLEKVFLPMLTPNFVES